MINEDFGKYLNDSTLKIPKSHLNKVCLFRKGKCACRYIALTASVGHVCVKNTPLKLLIDKEVLKNTAWKARGDNCDGFQTYEKETQKDT